MLTQPIPRSPALPIAMGLFREEALGWRRKKARAQEHPRSKRDMRRMLKAEQCLKADIRGMEDGASAVVLTKNQPQRADCGRREYLSCVCTIPIHLIPMHAIPMHVFPIYVIPIHGIPMHAIVGRNHLAPSF